MEEIYIKARAKINLSLEVLNKRKDNYHNIESVFQKINLYDEIWIRKIKTNEFKMVTNVYEINNKENIIYKAYRVLKEKYKNITGIEVKLNKKVPMQAGLGGGSADCASFIIAINKLFNLKMSKKEMEEIGKKLGADVVPCMYKKAVLVEGIGDIITKIDTNFKYYVLVIKPKISCSTKKMYEKLDESKIEKRYVSKNIIKALEENNINLLSKKLYNSFEEVIEDKDIIEKIKNELVQNGANASLMTGSGSSVYGIFENKEKAKTAYNKLRKKYEIYFCNVCN